MFDCIHQLPLWSAKAGATVVFLIVLIITWSLPKRFILEGVSEPKRWMDLRIWATLLILMQLAIYAVF